MHNRPRGFVHYKLVCYSHTVTRYQAIVLATACIAVAVGFLVVGLLMNTDGISQNLVANVLTAAVVTVTVREIIIRHTRRQFGLEFSADRADALRTITDLTDYDRKLATWASHRFAHDKDLDWRPWSKDVDWIWSVAPPYWTPQTGF